MASSPSNPVLRHIRRLMMADILGPATDRELLQRFARERDEAAFTSLVERHAAMVFGVCLRVLGHAHDAEDAFQATFLVLARRAASVRWRKQVGNWLHGVALRIAVKMRSRSRQKLPVESSAGLNDGRGQEPADHRRPSDPSREAIRRDLCRVLDEELSRLPGKYRSPLVLCYLEGRTNEEAARELGWPAGSMSRHLARGRELLRERLLRRGLALSGTLVAAVLAERSLSAAVPRLLFDSTIHAAVVFAVRSALVAGSASAEALALAEGILKAMTMTKLKAAVAVFLTLALVGIGTGGVWQTNEQKKDRDRAAAPAGDKPKPATAGQQAIDEKPGEPAAPAGPDPLQRLIESRTKRANLSLENRVELMQEKLSKPITLENGMDPNTQFKDAMEFLSDRYDFTIVIDDAAFKDQNPEENVEERPIRLPKMIAVDLRTVLRMITAQVGATFRARADYVEILPAGQSWPEEWVRSSQRHRVPRVSANFHARPLARAVQELSDQTGVNVVMDIREAKDAEQTQVTARFDDTPVDTAVALLADMGSLKSVAMDNVLYVTSKENADAILAERQRSRASPKQAEKPPAVKPEDKGGKAAKKTLS
jgi:RNA polymerase sigma factor (sigma-70 family)